jgi:hypothetical protein
MSTLFCQLTSLESAQNFKVLKMLKVLNMTPGKRSFWLSGELLSRKLRLADRTSHLDQVAHSA